MLWITLLFALLIAGAALVYTLWPLLRQDAPLLPVEDDRLTELLARKDSALRALKDLEFDHQVGKISDEDFQRFNYRLSRQAVGLIQQVEKLVPDTAQLDEALEAEIAALRQVRATTRVATKPTTESITESTTESTTANFCTECGAKTEPTFKFCATCGAKIVAPGATGAPSTISPASTSGDEMEK